MTGKATDIKELDKKQAITKAAAAIKAAENELNDMRDDFKEFKRCFREAESLDKKRIGVMGIAGIFNRHFSSHGRLLSAIIDLAKAAAE